MRTANNSSQFDSPLGYILNNKYVQCVKAGLSDFIHKLASLPNLFLQGWCVSSTQSFLGGSVGAVTLGSVVQGSCAKRPLHSVLSYW